MATLRELRPGDAGWILQQHALHYVDGVGFDASFETLVAEVLADFLRTADPSCDRGWIAETGGRSLGCIFCVRLDADTAKVRLFYLLPEARGQGLGHRLLDALTDHARRCGFAQLRLWTHAEHVEARVLYRRSGFDLISSTPVQSFGRALTEEIWEKHLRMV